MQLKVFILPLKNVSAAEAEMNAFLRSHRVLAVKKEFEIEDWGTDRIMAGQNHLLNGVDSPELLVLGDARLMGAAPLVFMILSRHDSVIQSWVEWPAETQRGWRTDRIMAGQNHLLNGVKSTELVALVEARLVASAPLAFMILSRHDSVIPLRNNPYAD